MRKINANELQGSEFARRSFVHTPADGVQVDDTLAPGYWAGVAGKLGFGDHVEVLPKNGAYHAELVVLDVGKTWAKMGLLRSVLFNKKANTAQVVNTAETPVEKSAGGTYVKWSSPHTKFRVHDEKTKEVLKDGFMTSDAAKAWAEAYSEPTAAAQ